MLCEKEELSGLESPATMPGRHRPSNRVVEKCVRREPAPDKNASPEPADAVSRNGGDGLQEIGSAREIGSAMGQGSDWTGEMNERKLAGTRRRLFDPIEPDRNADGRVPDEEGRSLA
jgi:hypothetical protein